MKPAVCFFKLDDGPDTLRSKLNFFLVAESSRALLMLAKLWWFRGDGDDKPASIVLVRMLRDIPVTWASLARYCLYKSEKPRALFISLSSFTLGFIWKLASLNAGILPSWFIDCKSRGLNYEWVLDCNLLEVPYSYFFPIPNDNDFGESISLKLVALGWTSSLIFSPIIRSS